MFLTSFFIANERCGLWYIPPSKRAETVYFKSTDGHTTQWDFSTRRLNLHIIDEILKNNGIIIVDSTRRGKKMPDSFSKTIPIWCAVINATLFETNDEDLLFTSPETVSRSENEQIKMKIIQWREKFINCGVNIDALKQKLDKPLRPLWVYPSAYLPYNDDDSKPVFKDFYPVILCTASKMVQDGQESRQGYTYVQGAADDHEEWAGKLDPNEFWENLKEFGSIDFSDEQLYQLIINCGKKNHGYNDAPKNLDISNISSTNISIGKYEKGQQLESNSEFEVLIVVTDSGIDEIDIAKNLDKKPDYIQILSLSCDKKGSKLLRHALPNIVRSIESKGIKSKKTLILCNCGSDISVGIALVLLSKYYDLESGQFNLSNYSNASKLIIRKWLVKILEFRKVNPSRATLLAVNSYLLG